MPLYAGFGISTPEQARAAAELADGIVVGSRPVEVAEEGPDALQRVRPHVARGCRRGGGGLTWLVLFDVDGTLLLTHDEVYVEASRLALEAVFGSYADGPDLPGDTAPAHIRRALRAASVPEPEIDAGLPRWCETFSAQYVRLLADADTSHWERGPHAFEAAAAVEHRALLTGNPPAVAHARMERLGLDELFPRGQGAFGCEREEPFGALRSRARASRQLAA